jgi:hypothetical protein
MRMQEIFQPWPSSGKIEDVTYFEQWDVIQLTINDQGQITRKDFELNQTNSVYKNNALELLKKHKGKDVGSVGEVDVEPTAGVVR